MTIDYNIESIRNRIAKVCDRSDRAVSEITLVAITKTEAVEKILEAQASGITIIGENRVQEAWTKYQQLKQENLCWHLVGHLQTNKVKSALQFVEIVQSVDSFRLAIEIDRIAKMMNKHQEVFMEVNTSDEITKFGVDPRNAVEIAHQINSLANLRLSGLMTIGAWTSDNQRIRACFAMLRQLKEEMMAQGLPLHHLSMGMSDDFEIAIEEGATILRIGRAIFGERIS